MSQIDTFCHRALATATRRRCRLGPSPPLPSTGATRKILAAWTFLRLLQLDSRAQSSPATSCQESSAPNSASSPSTSSRRTSFSIVSASCSPRPTKTSSQELHQSTPGPSQTRSPQAAALCFLGRSGVGSGTDWSTASSSWRFFHVVLRRCIYAHRR